MRLLRIFPVLLALCACEDVADNNIVGDTKVLSDTDNINQCITQIEALTHLQKVDEDGNDVKYAIVIPGYGLLSYGQALEISTNWDYDNLKLYTHQDKKLQEHEQDACEVLERLTVFIEKHNVSTDVKRW